MLHKTAIYLLCLRDIEVRDSEFTDQSFDFFNPKNTHVRETSDLYGVRGETQCTGSCVIPFSGHGVLSWGSFVLWCREGLVP